MLVVDLTSDDTHLNPLRGRANIQDAVDWSLLSLRLGPICVVFRVFDRGVGTSELDHDRLVTL
jgi:hypothetical protein